jgi:hypothetical protein
MRKFYKYVWRLAVHFPDAKELVEFKEGIELDTIRNIHETDDFILFETDALVDFAELMDDICRGTTPTFATIKQVLK